MFKNILIANRGEVALRIAQAASDLGAACVALCAADEPQAAHAAVATRTLALPGTGPAAYLEPARLVELALDAGCDAVHPGYGFLSESAEFAQACADAGLVFIGPTPAQMAVLGDKARARALALACGVPVPAGSVGAVSLDEARAFMRSQGGAGVMLKAIGGGGGRGMRAVQHIDDLPAAYERCQSEARAAFGRDDLVVEALVPAARHIELQVVGDGDSVVALGERECSLQRRFQKLVEIAPSPSLEPALRDRITRAALSMARSLGYRSLGTFEFLVNEAVLQQPFVFIEANARLQVEHTVTEQVLGLDLVQLQIRIAAGSRLAALGLDPARPPQPQGHAIQWRINAEVPAAAGLVKPAEGTVTRWQMPAGAGIRVDTHAAAGHRTSPQYDSLLAKLVVHAHGDFAAVLRRSRRALADCAVEGVDTNLPLLRALAARPEMQSQALDTDFVQAHWATLWPAAAGGAASAHALVAPMAGRLVQQLAAADAAVRAGADLAVLEAMKMEHLLPAPADCRVQRWLVQAGDSVSEGQWLALLEPASTPPSAAPGDDRSDAAPAPLRADLQRLQQRQAATLDAARPAAVAARHARGQRTARENIAALCDEGSFSEYGALAVAAQRRRRSEEDLIANTPADGMVTGIGSVNAAQFGPQKSRTVVMAYDATVLAGTQGFRNHHKTDRLLGLAQRNRLPVVLFAEGGGGRPGDVDMPIVAGLHVQTFASFARLSGQVPLLGIAAGRCFAGNAALLGCCDLVIATRGANIGMGGPAMIEGGGLGRFSPEQVGPASLQSRNGVIDLLVDDEVQAAASARTLLGLLQGALPEWDAPEVQALRGVVPENRLRVYDMHRALQALCDRGTVIELRPSFGAAVITALARIEGRAVGVLASNPAHRGGAIDADAADKAARFMQLCNAHGLPIVSLIDTPGFMVGPAAEEQAQVRHVARLFVTGAALRVPCFGVVLRKAYGLGAMALAAGSLHAPDFCVAWPSGEFGAMGLEGAVRLGYRKELEAAASEPEREALFARLLARQVEAGSAIHMAMTLEVDAVIDPAETRAWLVRGLAGARLREPAARFIDPW